MSAGRARTVVLALTDVLALVCVWAFTLWAYRAAGFGHYKFGAEFYLRLWPVAIAYIALNNLFRLYHGSAIHPAAPVSPVEELRRLVGSSVLTHLGLIAYLALAYQTTEHYSRAVILISGLLTAMLAQPARDAARLAAFRFRRMRMPVIVSGEGETARMAERVAELDAYLGFRVVKTVGANAKFCPTKARRSW